MSRGYDKVGALVWLGIAVVFIGGSVYMAYIHPKKPKSATNDTHKTVAEHGKRSSSRYSGITNPSSRYYDPIEEDDGDEDDVYYENCSEAREDGAESIEEGEPGYREELDRDGDGVACEPWRGR